MRNRRDLGPALLARAFTSLHGAQRRLAQVMLVAEGFADAALSTEGKARLSPLIYDRSPYYRGTALFDWEGPWFDAALPKAPARIVVGGCGAGREVLALERRGIHVVGFDPSEGLLAEARNNGVRSELLVGAYEDLLDDGTDLRRHLDAVGGFDAILLGWGSFGHLLDEALRVDVLRAARELCPRGTILGSFPHVVARAPDRAFQLGQRMGRILGAGDASPAHARFLPYAGFVACLDEESTRHEAERAGLKLTYFDASAYPHFTLAPASA